MKKLLQLTFILLAIAAIYSNTLDAAFHFDDMGNIVKNPLIRNLSAFADPSEALEFKEVEGIALSKLFSRRIVGYFTFALNYKFHALELRGYHLTNLAIHFISAALVYFLVLALLMTPVLKDTKLTAKPCMLAFVTALIFAVHPIQTQAVTYIVQRFSSLCALFFFASLLSYIHARLTQRGPAMWTLMTLSVATAVLAMKTKENAYTLLLVLALVEGTLFTDRSKRRWAMVMFMSALTVGVMLHAHLVAPGVSIDEATRLQTQMPRTTYFLTELRVIVTYMRLMVLPVSQNLDYDYHLTEGLFDMQLWGAIAVLGAVGYAMYYFWRRARQGQAAFIAPMFGVAFFFITLSVESSFIPIADVIFEHRLYLPSVGFIFAVSSMLFYFAPDGQELAVAWAMVLVVAISFSIATYTRNEIWKSEISLWQDAIAKSPNKARPHYDLADAYEAQRRHEEALREYELAASLAPEEPRVHAGLATMYFKLGRLDDATREFETALAVNPDNPELWSNLGLVYHQRSQDDKSVQAFERAVALGIKSPFLFYNLGEAYRALGRPIDAKDAIRRGLLLAPDSAPLKEALKELQ